MLPPNKPERRLAEVNHDFLKTLWKWKTLNFWTIKRISLHDRKSWSAYYVIRKLLRDGLLAEENIPKLGAVPLRLTKKSFERIAYDLGHLREKRFLPQSVPHDYLASCFQMGNFLLKDNENVHFFTEQQIHCTEDSLLPSWVPRNREHIPDGLTKIEYENGPKHFGIEVELHIKPVIRYGKIGFYYDHANPKFDGVFWLVESLSLMEEILRLLKAADLRRLNIHHFVLLADFKRFGWNAIVRNGFFARKSIREAYGFSDVLGSNEIAISDSLVSAQDFFFNSTKSPWIPMASKVLPDRHKS